MSTLQYRPDNDHLLYIDDIEGDPLAAECCCTLLDITPPDEPPYDPHPPIEDDPDPAPLPPGDPPDAGYNVVFYPCCTDIPFDDRIEHPNFIVVTDTWDNANGNPGMVVYHDCCYYRWNMSIFPANVDNTDISVSSTTTCQACNAEDGADCLFYETTCNGCNPDLKGKYNIEVTDGVGGSICDLGPIEGMQVPVYVATEVGDDCGGDSCSWAGTKAFTSGIYNVKITAYLTWVTDQWNVDLDWIWNWDTPGSEIYCSLSGSGVYGPSGEEYECQPTGVYAYGSSEITVS